MRHGITSHDGSESILDFPFREIYSSQGWNKESRNVELERFSTVYEKLAPSRFFWPGGPRNSISPINSNRNRMDPRNVGCLNESVWISMQSTRTWKARIWCLVTRKNPMGVTSKALLHIFYHGNDLLRTKEKWNLW